MSYHFLSVYFLIVANMTCHAAEQERDIPLIKDPTTIRSLVRDTYEKNKITFWVHLTNTHLLICSKETTSTKEQYIRNYLENTPPAFNTYENKASCESLPTQQIYEATKSVNNAHKPTSTDPKKAFLTAKGQFDLVQKMYEQRNMKPLALAAQNKRHCSIS